MKGDKKHIGSNNMFKDKCMEFLQKKIKPTNENYLKEQIEGVLKEAHSKRVIMPDYNYKIKEQNYQEN